MRRILFLFACFANFVIAGCHGDSNLPVATGEGTIRAINAIKTSPSLRLLIEERLIGNFTFKSTSNPLSYDDLEFTFNIEAIMAGDLLATRVASQFLDVVKDTEYTLLISGALAAPDITVWELPKRDWDGSETVFEMRFANTADSLGNVDVYFSVPGIPPTLGNAVGTLSFGEVLPVVDYEAGDYVLFFTAAGDPSVVRFESSTISLGAQNSSLITIFDSDANDTGLWSVRAFFAAGATIVISDVNATATARFYHASSTMVTADISNDETMMAPPIVANHAYRDVTGDIELPIGLNLLFYTDAANVGAPLLDGQVTTQVTTHKNVYAVGDDVGLRTVQEFPDRRSIETLAKVTVLNASINHPTVDVYIVGTGIDIADVIPTFVVVTVGNPSRFTTIGEGSFEIYVTPPADQTVIVGPIALDTVLGDVFEFIIYDNLMDPMTADVVSIPLP